MYIADKEIQSTLNSILSTSYEMFEHKQTIPCITYKPNSNAINALGDTLQYSYINYTVNLWMAKLSDAETYCKLIDDAMRELGFRRTSSNDVVYDKNKICRSLTYQALAQEIIT